MSSFPVPWNRRKKRPVDAYGRRVPTRLVEAFRTRGVLLDWAAGLDLNRRKIALLSEMEGAEEIKSIELSRHITAIQRYAQLHAPFLPCEACKAGEDCPKCKGRGWMTVQATIE